MARILAISDVELGQLYNASIRDRHQGIDLVLSLGDLPMYYLDYISSALNVPLYYVLGNHHADSKRQEASYGRGPADWDCGNNLHQRFRRFEDSLLFLGMEGSIRYNYGPAQYTQEMMWSMCLRCVPRLMLNYALYGRFLDIFATHSPPYQIHDADDPPHIGFKAFRWFLKTFQPQFHLHGHIHLYRQDAVRETVYYRTRIINCYGYQVIEAFEPKRNERR